MEEQTKQIEESSPPVTGAELEQQLLQKEEKKYEGNNFEEMAAMCLSLYTPKFRQLVDSLSTRQLKRVLKSLVEYPLGKEYKHRQDEEAQCFMIGNSLLESKFVLISSTYNEHREQIIEESKQNQEEKQKEEVNNG